MVQDTGRRAEAVRDLKSQIADLTVNEAAEVVFLDISPGRRRVTIYSMQTGEPIPVPAYMVQDVMDRKLPGGGFAFTSDSEKAPEYKLGTVKCFLHPDSPDRPILNEIGLGRAVCPAAHLASEYEKRLHGQHRHGKQWKAYQEYLERQERQEEKNHRNQQLEATLAMARAAGGQVAAVTLVSAHCDDCGKDLPQSKSPDKSLAMHQRLHCPAREKAEVVSQVSDEPGQDR